MQGPHHTAGVFRTLITVLVALLVSLRVVVQPLVLAAPEPGLMALCSGGQIVYVSIETGQPVETDSESATLAEPCPFYGVTAFDLTDNPEMPHSSEFALSLEKHLHGPPAVVARLFHQNAARGPPSRAS